MVYVREEVEAQDEDLHFSFAPRDLFLGNYCMLRHESEYLHDVVKGALVRHESNRCGLVSVRGANTKALLQTGVDGLEAVKHQPGVPTRFVWVAQENIKLF